ncbi:MAG TPA: NlpC/P60 family protein, partial [Fimbriimonadaceae bacterium]|nr:NlpC/P60 family protein [Fimbriimonadaceae bacterium]
AGSAPSAFALQGDGLWIGSEQGLLFLDPAKPDPETGFGGFVRVPFGVPAPTDPASRRLADAIFAWRFASADKAGKDGGAMVASVFSAFGLKLPEAAAELKRTGEPVTGEIQFGDVILTDKSAAIYLGNGTTVAVKGNRVENGDIWAYPNAVVRRFVPSS